MKYALNKCDQIKVPEGVKFTGPCYSCKKEISVIVPPDTVDRWLSGNFIQDVLPNHTADEREFLISGTCGPCYDNMFREKS